MSLKYPITADTPEKKFEFCYIADEKLRLEHNAKGKDFRAGKITEAQWKSYLEKVFKPKSKLLCETIPPLRKQLASMTAEELINKKKLYRKSTNFDVNLADLFDGS